MNMCVGVGDVCVCKVVLVQYTSHIQNISLDRERFRWGYMQGTFFFSLTGPDLTIRVSNLR